MSVKKEIVAATLMSALVNKDNSLTDEKLIKRAFEITDAFFAEAEKRELKESQPPPPCEHSKTIIENDLKICVVCKKVVDIERLKLQ